MPEPGPHQNVKMPRNATPSVTGPENEQPSIFIPDHTLVRPIGKGSYGEVWLARTTLGVYRAVKIVYRRTFDDDRPFERELAGIERFEPISRTHESQLNILHVGRGPDCFYYVMELADDARCSSSGEPSNAEVGLRAVNTDTYTPRTLRSELLFRSRLPMDECLRLGLALTTALEHLHRHGLVHRDIKPSNIVFVNGIPKLADIGLVARAEAAPSFVGTEGYLPPEGPGTRQADLFSLGKVLYELSTGRDRQQFPELPTNITQLPDRAALSEFNEVLLRACAPDARQRYQSAAEMHADLALLQSGKSVARLRANELRLKFIVRAGALVTAIAVLAGAAFLYQQAQTRKARQLAHENRRLVEESRTRLVRLGVANGLLLLDEGDSAGALLWFAEALPLVSSRPAEESIHRIRIQQVLNQTPRLLQVFPHEDTAVSVALSSDGKRIATGTQSGGVCVWDVKSGAPLWKPIVLSTNYSIAQLRFTRDNRRLQASQFGYGWVADKERYPKGAAVVDVETGRRVWDLIDANLERADFSPDDRWLVTADTSHVIRVLDAADGHALSKFQGQTNQVLFFSLSTNGILASTGVDGVRLWRLPSGEPIAAPLFKVDPWSPSALSVDGTLLVTVNSNRPCHLQRWDVETGEKLGRPIELPGQLKAMGFVSKSSRRLFVLTDRIARVLDFVDDSGKSLPLEAQQFNKWSLSWDGRILALGEQAGGVRLYDLKTGESVPAAPTQAGLMNFDLFDPNGSSVLATCTERAVTLWGLNRPLENATHHLSAPVAVGEAWQTWHLRPSPDRRRLLVSLQDGEVELVDVATLAEEKLSPGNLTGQRPRFAPDNRQWAIAYGQGDESRQPCVNLWREEGAERKRLMLPHPRTISGLQFDPTSRFLITKCDDAQIRVWRTADGALEKAISLPESLDPDGVLLPDGRSSFFSTEHGLVIFDFMAHVTTGKLNWTGPYGLHELTDWQLDRTGERLATATREGGAQIWRMPTGEALTRFQHGSELQSIEWSPDETRVLTAGASPEVKVWDALTGNEMLLPLRLGSKPLQVAQWSLDGRFIVARSDQNVVRVWDASTGEPVTQLLKHNGYVRFAHLLANNRLLTLTMPGFLRAWDLTETRLPADVIRDYARLSSGREISAVGVMVPLKPAELVGLTRSLRARAPQLFE